jgi:uncharacterized protein YeaO (DUF488 family)
LFLDQSRIKNQLNTELRKWFGHEPAKQDKFRERYLQELKNNEKQTSSIFGPSSVTEKAIDVHVSNNQEIIRHRLIARQGINVNGNNTI